METTMNEKLMTLAGELRSYSTQMSRMDMLSKKHHEFLLKVVAEMLAASILIDESAHGLERFSQPIKMARKFYNSEID